MSWAFPDVVGENGFHAVGNMGLGELVGWGLEGGIGGELDDHVVGKGMEEY